ncbi:RNA polymerase sigma-70 factor [Mucilaginibacter endophyticus]|jgi:RNA polymerase sigma-70 factor (ECF subfamily)|uniref:RNA polymerase sigma-70 factor n=1 Tax=Mucilaginibacter endophyticus TaxID=2675003 RepID=UPI000E0CF3F8|nr:RNA polymerase sigma-70 factor [Mucilaginibacter endophyticus]
MRRYRLPFYSDLKLLSLLTEGDDVDAFEEIYHRYWRVLLDTAFQRLKSKEAAQEIVQEVMINLFIKRKEININTSLEAWLKTALKYKVFNIYRSQQIHLTHLDEIIRQSSISPLTPDEAMTLKEIRKRINEAASKLPEKCRQVFMLSRFEHLSQQEIAERLKISVSTVKKHLTRALAAIREELREDHFNLFSLIILIIISVQ